MKKILIATIVPFWKRQTGAQQRIFALVKALQNRGHCVRVFFPGHVQQIDHQSAQRLGLDVSFHSSDRPLANNKSLCWKFKWQIKAGVHAVIGSVIDACWGRQLRADRRASVRLGDYRWPWAEDAFRVVVDDFSPDAIICEYITMAYLVESLPEHLRTKVHCLVDTHDLLSERKQQFAQHQRAHWIDVSPQQEAQALRAFDTVIAIQPLEAEQLIALVDDKPIIVVGHQPQTPVHCRKIPTKTARLTLGYLGSDNDSNADAINNFLENVWQQFADQSRLRLCVAGSVTDRVEMNLRFGNVRLLGVVPEVGAFYDAVDGVINPALYGTGLKIKSVEAIAHGKPLLCTPAGCIGVPPQGVTVVQQVDHMADVIASWASGGTVFEEVRGAAASAADVVAGAAYDPLLNLLDRL